MSSAFDSDVRQGGTAWTGRARLYATSDIIDRNLIIVATRNRYTYCNWQAWAFINLHQLYEFAGIAAAAAVAASGTLIC